MAYLRPGVFVEEISPANAPVSGVSSTSIAAFSGYTLKGPTTPTLVSSWTEFTKLFGSWDSNQSNNTVVTAAYLFFANGGSQCYIHRVTGSGAAAATRTLNDSSVTTVTAASASGGVVTYTANNTFAAGQTVSITGLSTAAFNLTNVTIASASSTQFTVSNSATGTGVTGASAVASLGTLTVTAINKGAWANTVYIGISASSVGTSYFTLTVYSGGSSSGNIVERFTDITMNVADAAYAIPAINGTSNYITVADINYSDSFEYTDNPATTVSGGIDTPNGLSGGTNGSSVAYSDIVTAITGGALDVIHSPLLLNVPGLVGTTSSATDVNNLLTYVAGNKPSVFVVLDGLNDTVSNQLTAAALYNTTSQAAVYYPSLVIPHPTSPAPGATLTVPNGAAVIGRYISTDASRGVFKSPAGLEARLSGVVSVAALTSANLDSLNSAVKPVNAIRYIPGSGIVIMGARTLDQSYANRYVSVRRSLIYLRKSLSDLTQFAIFEPNNFALWNRLSSTVENFLTAFWQQGGLSGQTPADAFYVKCDEDNNTPLQVQNGEVVIEIGVALQRPAEFVVIRISQYDSGSVVTIS